MDNGFLRNATGNAVVGLPVVESCMMGYNASIFAYGMTGAGKTFTMLGSMSAPEQVSGPTHSEIL